MQIFLVKMISFMYKTLETIYSFFLIAGQVFSYSFEYFCSKYWQFYMGHENSSTVKFSKMI